MAVEHLLPTIIVRLLPPEEWDRLREFGHFKALGVLPDPQHARVLVLETEESFPRIVGCWMAKDEVLLEGLCIAEEYRQRPSAARKLFFGMMQLLKRAEVGQALTVTQDEAIADLARKAGFETIPGSIHLLTLKNGKEGT